MIRRGDILFITLPSPDLTPAAPTVGSEAAYDRPAVVVQADSFRGSPNTLLIVPATTKSKAASVPWAVAVDPTSANCLRTRTVFLPFLIQAIDRSRIIDTLGRLEDEHLESIEASLRYLLEL